MADEIGRRSKRHGMISLSEIFKAVETKGTSSRNTNSVNIVWVGEVFGFSEGKLVEKFA